MWVTQTYLGTVEPEAKLFVYYFFEDYAPEQKKFTERVQIELERLGEAFGDKVSLLMPNPRYAGRIEAEVRENRHLWESLHGNLPGLFISKKPLAQLKPTDDGCVYIPFETRHPDKAAKAIQEVRRIANETLHWDHVNNAGSPKKSFGGTFFEALELKPGLFGFRIDLKKLARR
ncbi:MAG: hypothetical protein JSS57_06910 [Proteobacteria bacterium]|nr:hypothetical protein [Pseudomonadota bacterium]